MRIAFSTPLKGPDHPVPSGDRTMARLVVAALRQAGHTVSLLSDLRSFSAAPRTAEGWRALRTEAEREIERIATAWAAEPETRPDLILTYHLYYKAPDLLAGSLAARFGLPFVTIEASHAPKRAHGPWREGHLASEAGISAAAAHFCFTPNDRNGLLGFLGQAACLFDLPPFIDAGPRRPVRTEHDGPPRLIVVAMMRPGDKLASYRFLAEALAPLQDHPWTLTLVGDGSARPEVEQAFARLSPERVAWPGILDPERVEAALAHADLFVWPGLNEAFGLSYLEAQSFGLPAVAVRGDGTPSVIRHNETGLLTAPAPETYGAALRRLLDDPDLRTRLGAAASRFVHGERTLAGAAARLDAGLREAVKRHTARGIFLEPIP